MSYDRYDDHEDLNIRFHTRDRGNYERPPPPPPPRQYRYTTGGGRLDITSSRHERSRSREYVRAPSPAAPPQPVIINNRIYNDYDDDYEEPPRQVKLQVVSPGRERSRSRHRRRSSSSYSSRSRSRSRSRHRREKKKEEPQFMTKQDFELERMRREVEDLRRAQAERKKPSKEPERPERPEKPSGYMSKEEYELERTRKELEKFKLDQQRKEDERLMRKELELKRLRDEKPSGYMSKEEYELERARKELEKFKHEQQRLEDEKLLKKELELKRLREEKEAEDEADRKKKAADEAVKEFQIKKAEKEAKEKKAADEAIKEFHRKEAERAAKEKKAADDAIKEYQRKEAEKAAKEKKEKEEREKEYKQRLQDDLKKFGNMTDDQIAKVLKKEKIEAPAPPPPKVRPTYTRMARRYLSFETLNAFRIDYTIDQDPEYILIKRWVPEHEQDVLWEHTKELRERRARAITNTSTTTTVLQIEDNNHHHRQHSDGVQYEFVKKRDRKRDKSPGLITFLAGGKR